MKVIFLDVDGVLNSNAYVDYTLKNNVKGILEEIDPKTIEMLKYALDVTDAQIVVSSSWRNIRKFEQLKELFLRYGINLDEKTPVLGHERGLEIKQYLEENSKYWSIKGDKIVFTNNNVIVQYYNLINKLNS